MLKFRVLVVLAAILLQVVLADASIIHGKVFSWETLDPVNGAIVEINTTPVQKKVTENGSYIFESVPPGNYTITAMYISEGVKLYAKENITVISEGKYVLDIILFPEIEFPEFQDIEEIDFTIEEEGFNYYLLIPVLVVAITGVAVYILKTKRKRAVVPEVVLPPRDENQTFESLPDDLKEVVEILIKSDGRMSQKELRRKLGCSEAKISLMISDLERREIVEKVKKGRGNIIFLRDEFLR